jgi:hypothetical protein
MTSFEAGFVKYAEELGLSDKEAVLAFKRAMEHPEAAHFLKGLDTHTGSESPQKLAALSELMYQQKIDDEMTQAAKSIRA